MLWSQTTEPGALVVTVLGGGPTGLCESAKAKAGSPGSRWSLGERARREEAVHGGHTAGARAVDTSFLIERCLGGRTGRRWTHDSHHTEGSRAWAGPASRPRALARWPRMAGPSRPSPCTGAQGAPLSPRRRDSAQAGHSLLRQLVAESLPKSFPHFRVGKRVWRTWKLQGGPWE